MKRIGIKSGPVEGAAPHIPKLDGSPAKICAESPNADEKRAYCSLCGAKGHDARTHAAGLMKARPSGEAIEENRESQAGWLSKSSQFTGNANYKSPGSEGGMS